MSKNGQFPDELVKIEDTQIHSDWDTRTESQVYLAELKWEKVEGKKCNTKNMMSRKDDKALL